MTNELSARQGWLPMRAGWLVPWFCPLLVSVSLAEAVTFAVGSPRAAQAVQTSDHVIGSTGWESRSAVSPSVQPQPLAADAPEGRGHPPGNLASAPLLVGATLSAAPIRDSGSMNPRW
ncbi:MAG: hypothetical protein JOY61_20040 [Chloroflexi bacterium]|nr:hypothetical protein [Chloroflexota bacterium]